MHAARAAPFRPIQRRSPRPKKDLLVFFSYDTPLFNPHFPSKWAAIRNIDARAPTAQANATEYTYELTFQGGTFSNGSTGKKFSTASKQHRLWQIQVKKYKKRQFA